MGHDLIARNQKSKVRGPVFFVGTATFHHRRVKHDTVRLEVYRMGRVYGTILHTAKEVFFVPIETKPEIDPCPCDDCVRRAASV
jgi:hypothetical protein